MGVCNINCIILQTKRARFALNKEIFDLTRKAILEHAVIELAINYMRSLPQVFEKVSGMLKCHSNFLGSHTNTYIRECSLCRDGTPSSTTQYKLPDNISTNPTSEGSL